MDTIRFLLGKVIQLAFGLLLLVCVLWLVGLLFPSFSFSQGIQRVNIFNGDWLPAPKNYGSLFTPAKQNANGTYGTVYTPGKPYNGYTNAPPGSADVDWAYYSATGTQIVKSSKGVNNQVYTGNTSVYAEKSLYVRNLSIYDGGSLSYGSTIVGEARDTMFKNGTFTILVLDREGRVLANTQAANTGAWSTPGWVRFQFKIASTLPRNTPCTLVFISANQPIKIGMNVRCN